MTNLLARGVTPCRLAWDRWRCAETDTMAIEMRPWPGQADETAVAHDAGPDLVIHEYSGDGEAWLWEIEHASQRRGTSLQP